MDSPTNNASPTSGTPAGRARQQQNYIVVPNVASVATVESGVPGVAQQVRPGTTVNISAILNSKIKIQPKPGDCQGEAGF